MQKRDMSIDGPYKVTSNGILIGDLLENDVQTTNCPS